jgi:aerobic-type carbon monoxide dehydrogenase small subunit (CoxS/CutS family)
MILAATALLKANPNPTDTQIIQAMDGNICRCGVYPAILQAIRSAAESMSKGT